MYIYERQAVKTQQSNGEKVKMTQFGCAACTQLNPEIHSKHLGFAIATTWLGLLPLT